MAISVKNLDDRIKVLESKTSKVSTDVSLLGTEFFVSQNITVPAMDSNSDCWIGVVPSTNLSRKELTGHFGVIPLFILNLCRTYEFRFGDPASIGDEVRLKWLNNTTINVTRCGNDGTYRVYLIRLKIYYIFRYNILAKILRSNISRFSHFLHQNTNFGGEFRMAISIKNHEDRIVNLEKKIVESGYSETVLWSSSGTTNPSSLKLSQTIRNFDLVIFYYNHYTNGGPYTKIEPTSQITSENLDIWIGSDMASSVGRAVWVKTSDGITLQFARRDVNAIFYKITGIKFSKVILYYFSNIIKLKFILRINSRNSHFRQAS